MEDKNHKIARKNILIYIHDSKLFAKEENKLETQKSNNNTGLQRNWRKHKNTHFYLIWGYWIQIWNLFLLIASDFQDMHSVHLVHIGYIKAYMNSGLILILWD